MNSNKVYVISILSLLIISKSNHATNRRRNQRKRLKISHVLLNYFWRMRSGTWYGELLLKKSYILFHAFSDIGSTVSFCGGNWQYIEPLPTWLLRLHSQSHSQCSRGQFTEFFFLLLINVRICECVWTCENENKNEDENVWTFVNIWEQCISMNVRMRTN